jgi:hypothetical protein
MADFLIEPNHTVQRPGGDIPELLPEHSRRFTTGELVEVRVSPDIAKLRLPSGAQCSVLYADHAEIHLTNRLRANSCRLGSLKGPEGSTLDINHTTVT